MYDIKLANIREQIAWLDITLKMQGQDLLPRYFECTMLAERLHEYVQSTCPLLTSSPKGGTKKVVLISS